MGNYFGQIHIDSIQNVRGSSELSEIFKELEDNAVRFIHYSDCQQLCIWLPRYGREYGEIRLRKDNTREIVRDWQTKDILNGSIQLLWDTLSIPPGEYCLEIDWKSGWLHQVTLSKFEAEIFVPVPAATMPARPARVEQAIPSRIIYRDSFSKPVVDEDLLLRDKLLKDILHKFTRHLEYEGNLRAGYITYVEGDLRIRFSYEMGDGDCLVYIEMPSEQYWEAQTKTELYRRNDILEFMAKEVQSKQAPNCSYEIKQDTIVFRYR